MTFPRISALTALLVLGGCGQGQQAGPPPPPAVTVAKPVKRAIVDQEIYVGRFVAVDMVEVRARVSGFLDKILFKDGQIVKEGQPLFALDKRPFQNAVDQARGNVAQTKAVLAFTESDLTRAQQLLRDKTIAEQVYEQRQQAKRTAEGSVAGAEASLRQAELDLSFTDVISPMAGHIGDRRVSPGNLVAGGTAGTTTLLATIVSMDPIRFEFTFDEAAYLRLQKMRKTGENANVRTNVIDVRLKLIGEKEFSRLGSLDFVDNVIDRSTGTIRGRASFPNPTGELTPGMFATIRMPSSAPYQAPLIPDSAIGSEQARKYVLTVNAENTVVLKYVTPGELSDNLRVIKQGIDENDRVIVNGLMRARPGQKVTPQEEGAAPAAAAPKAEPKK